MTRLVVFIIGLIFSSFVQADFLGKALKAISVNDELRKNYTEIWQADYLNDEVVSHGVLNFEPPDILVKEVTSPESLTYTISGDSVKVKKGENVKHLKLSDNPELAMGIYTIRMLLQGDREGLEEIFLIQFRHTEKDFQSWDMEFFPRSKYKQVKIKKITASGNEGDLDKLTIEYNNGDVHITKIYSDE